MIITIFPFFISLCLAVIVGGTVKFVTMGAKISGNNVRGAGFIALLFFIFDFYHELRKRGLKLSDYFKSKSFLSSIFVWFWFCDFFNIHKTIFALVYFILLAISMYYSNLFSKKYRGE